MAEEEFDIYGDLGIGAEAAQSDAQVTPQRTPSSSSVTRQDDSTRADSRAKTDTPAPENIDDENVEILADVDTSASAVAARRSAGHAQPKAAAAGGTSAAAGRGAKGGAPSSMVMGGGRGRRGHWHAKPTEPAFKRRPVALFLTAPPETRESTSGEEPSADQAVLISGLAWWVNDVELRERLEEYGTVRTIRMLEYPTTGKATGHAYVEFMSSEAASKCRNGISTSVLPKAPPKGGRPSIIEAHPLPPDMWTTVRTPQPPTDIPWTLGGPIIPQSRTLLLTAGTAQKRPLPPRPGGYGVVTPPSSLLSVSAGSVGGGGWSGTPPRVGADVSGQHEEGEPQAKRHKG